MNNNESLFKPGSIVGEKWEILCIIGSGAFGVVAQVKNLRTQEIEAIKFEMDDPSTKGGLMQEVRALQSLQESPFITKLVSWGKYENWKYMVMSLFGENLVELQKSLGQFSLSTVLYIGIKSLQCLEGVHAKGFVHRDIKPSNFVIGITNETRKNIYLIDFGIAKRHVGGELRKEVGGFRGTDHYASVNSHMGRALGMHDDLWSLWYMLCDLLGKLPWRNLDDRNKIGEAKKKFNNQEYIEGIPSELILFRNHLKTLTIDNTPNYDYLKELLQIGLNSDNKDNCPWLALPINPKFILLSDSPKPLKLNTTVDYSSYIVPDIQIVTPSGVVANETIVTEKTRSMPAKLPTIKGTKSADFDKDLVTSTMSSDTTLGASIPQSKWIGSFVNLSEQSGACKKQDQLNSECSIDFGTDTEELDLDDHPLDFHHQSNKEERKEAEVTVIESVLQRGSSKRSSIQNSTPMNSSIMINREDATIGSQSLEPNTSTSNSTIQNLPNPKVSPREEETNSCCSCTII